jgi:hypothetical protein
MKKIIVLLALCFCCNSFSQINFKKTGQVFATVSYFMGKQDQCTTLWVGIFATENDQTLLVSSGIVRVGESCTSKTKPVSTNSSCVDEKYKGDFIENSSSKEFKYCLIDYLKNDDLYLKFQAEKYRVLSTLKK